VVGLLYVIKSVAIYYSTVPSRASAGLLILNIYGVTLAVVTLIQDHQIAALRLYSGLCRASDCPIISGTETGAVADVFNIFPFLFLISRTNQYGWTICRFLCQRADGCACINFSVFQFLPASCRVQGVARA
jgi:hypothetical protein